MVYAHDIVHNMPVIYDFLFVDSSKFPFSKQTNYVNHCSRKEIQMLPHTPQGDR